MELRRSMPKAIWRDLRTQRPAIPPTCGESKEQQELPGPAAHLKRKVPPQHTEPAGQGTEQNTGPGIEALTASNFLLDISQLGNEKAGRRFHRDGAAFSNSNLEERALHLDGLEEQLVKAVASESWDRVCSLIREAAAALASPRQKAALIGAAAPMPEDAQERLQANLQSRLRKLICQGLGYLDLSDAGTASQLEPALSFMKLLIERFKVRGQLEEARAAKQWLLLQGLLTADATKEAEPNLESYFESYFGSSVIERSRRREAAKTTTAGGRYIPRPKIQENPLVRNTFHDVLVTCNKCGFELRSSWVFDHRGKLRTLVPINGHKVCGGRYVSVTGSLLVWDTVQILEICPHNTRRAICVKCRGSLTCTHKKQRSRCRLCLARKQKDARLCL
ncbi:unnamed protein product [Polarella glacialis]|uniref:Uncharacterized protein n=1 Tax=Polarella glacialis TaxID=89957 RepID=A0A813EJ23_POLGL|nr:unnamed protein product [Polarella glacialis]